MSNLQEILNQVREITLVAGDATTVITAMTYDSREVEEGTLFIALRGERFDGHDFIERAVHAGAAAILVDEEFVAEQKIPDGVAVLSAPDTRGVLALLGCAFYAQPAKEMRLIGITGTNGKTSSTYLLEAIFRATHKKVGVIGTVEYRWGEERVRAPNTTPDGLILQGILRQMADAGVEIVILEVSSHGLASRRVEGVDFDVALFTNLSQDHLDFHQSMEAYREAKRRLFLDILPGTKTKSGELPLAVINVDDGEGRALRELLKDRKDQRLITFGIRDQGAQIRGEALRVDISGVQMSVVAGNDEPFEVFSSMPGHFNGENLLGAVAVARAMGISAATIQAGLRDFSGVPGRMERVVADSGPATFVDFAHTPDALKRALETLRPLTRGALWVVFGCGGDRDREKRPIMGKIAAKLADQIVLTSDNPRNEPPEAIIDAIEAGVREVRGTVGRGVESWLRQVDRAQAIELALQSASGDDVVLIAGKGHETYQEIAGERRPFDDREVAALALSRRGQT